MENEHSFVTGGSIEPERIVHRTDIPKIQIQQESAEEEPEDVLWLDFQSGDDAEGVRSAGVETYVISPVTERNLFSDKYLNCTGAVGIGRHRVSGREIAFISHQDPEYFLHKGSEEAAKFSDDLKSTLRDLLAKSEEGTVEIVLFGGNDDPTNPGSKKSTDYKKSMGMLTEIIQSVTSVTPTVLLEANHAGGAIDVTVLTQERKVLVGE